MRWIPLHEAYYRALMGRLRSSWALHGCKTPKTENRLEQHMENKVGTGVTRGHMEVLHLGSYVNGRYGGPIIDSNTLQGLNKRISNSWKPNTI